MYGATSRFTREIHCVYITLSLCVKQSSILDKYMLTLEVGVEFVGEVLLSSVRSKASNVPTGFFLDLSLELLEVREHFALLLHREDPRVARVVIERMCVCVCVRERE